MDPKEELGIVWGCGSLRNSGPLQQRTRRKCREVTAPVGSRLVVEVSRTASGHGRTEGCKGDRKELRSGTSVSLEVFRLD